MAKPQSRKRRSKGRDKLTPKQEAFVKHYCGDCFGNASESARRAGYSEKTAGSVGQENLKKPAILQAIEKERARLQKKSDALTPDEIHEIWAKLARDKETAEKTKLRATELAAKTFGMLDTKKPGDDGPVHRVNIYLPDNGR